MHNFALKTSNLPWYRILLGGLFLTLAGHLMTGCETNPVVPTSDPNDEILITSPVGGESITIGDTLRIKWKLQGKGLTEVNAVNIELSPDSGKTWVGLLKKSVSIDDPLWGNYPWAVLNEVLRLGVTYSLENNSKILLKVMQYSTADTNKIAITKKTFSILKK